MTRSIDIEDVRRAEAGVWCARLADGDLSDADRRAFDTWLDASANRDAFDDALAVWHAVEAARSTPDLIVLRGQALEVARRANRRRWATGWLSPRGRWLALAACLLVAVMLGGAWLRYAPRSYVTGVGERRVVALADGSRVSLDAATEVQVRYLRDRRQLWLKRGRAKFAVAKDPLRPFSVTAGGKMVVATGTEFSVELLRDQLHVVLYQGRVAVLQAPGPNGRAMPIRLVDRRAAPNALEAPSADQMLTPGRELISPANSLAAEVVATDAGRSLSWEAGQLVFDDEPLASAAERINRYADRKVAVDPGAADVRISGVFTAGDVNAFVVGVTEVFPLRAQRSTSGVTLLKENPTT